MAAPSKFLALSNEVMFLIMDCLTTREQLPLITACRECHMRLVGYLHKHLRVDLDAELSAIEKGRTDLVQSITMLSPSEDEWPTRCCLESALPLFPNVVSLDLSEWRWTCIHTIPFAAWQNLKELDINNCVDPLCFAAWGDCHAPDARRTNVFPVLPSLRRLSGTICIVRTIIQYAPGVTHLSFKPSRWGCEFRAFEPQSDFPPYLPNICHAEHVAIDPPVARDSRFEELLSTVFPKMSNVNHIQFTYYRGEMKTLRSVISSFPRVKSLRVLRHPEDVDRAGTTLSLDDLQPRSSTLEQLTFGDFDKTQSSPRLGWERWDATP